MSFISVVLPHINHKYRIMKTLSSNAGRIIFSIPFLVFGLFHFMNAMSMLLKDLGLPGATLYLSSHFNK